MSKSNEIVLIYNGTLPQHINGVPARNLTVEDIKQVAQLWGISTTETEGLLIQHKLYAFAPSTPKTTKQAAEAATETKEGE
jgi:hypothetical protein